MTKKKTEEVNGIEGQIIHPDPEDAERAAAWAGGKVDYPTDAEEERAKKVDPSLHRVSPQLDSELQVEDEDEGSG